MIEQVRLGSSGLHVSRLALGMMSYGSTSYGSWVLDEPAAEPIVKRAVELGVTFFDTADMYGDGASEIVSGKLLRKLIPREEAVVATKVFYPTTGGPNGRGLSRKHILAAIDASLERLGLDYVDLYQVHRWDEQTPIEETMEALHDVVKAGKARYLGASATAAWQFAKAQTVAERYGWTRFTSMQHRWNLIDREIEREMVPLCLDQRVAVVPYSPLARGLLAGSKGTTRAASDRLRIELRPADEAVLACVADIARERGVAPAQIALAWLFRKKAVTAPIIGATRDVHIDDAVAASTLALGADELERLEACYLARPPESQR
jgi:aryl-alcohol dehydrogenase-like predicted oxidoreductase